MWVNLWGRYAWVMHTSHYRTLDEPDGSGGALQVESS
jgi:hypothetical protein